MPELDFHRRFHPLTAHPFDREDCAEYLPCPALAPWVRCFWGPVARRYSLVVPDACADIIIRTDEGRLDMAFCPVDNTPFHSHTVSQSLFGVRFYMWALPWVQRGDAFDEGSFPDLRGYLLQEGFLEKDFFARMAMMEAYFLQRLDDANVSSAFLNVMDRMLRTCGRESVAMLAEHEAISPRTLERLFRRSMGLPPKEALGVIRYQTLWRRCLTQPGLDLLDQVEALGFCDQAHLLNTFRRFHGMSLQAAVQQAKDVAFLQDRMQRL